MLSEYSSHNILALHLLYPIPTAQVSSFNFLPEVVGVTHTWKQVSQRKFNSKYRKVYNRQGYIILIGPLT